MTRKVAKQEAVEVVEAIFLVEILSSFLFNIDIVMEFVEVILSFTSSSTNELGSNVGSIEGSIDFDCINDFYTTQFQDHDDESNTYLTNDDVLDKLPILLGLEYHRYLAPKDYISRSQDFIAQCVPETSIPRFCQLFQMDLDGFESILGIIINHDQFPNMSTSL